MLTQDFNFFRNANMTTHNDSLVTSWLKPFCVLLTQWLVSAVIWIAQKYANLEVTPCSKYTDPFSLGQQVVSRALVGNGFKFLGVS